jgi:hypothetical protein
LKDQIPNPNEGADDQHPMQDADEEQNGEHRGNHTDASENHPHGRVHADSLALCRYGLE